MDDIIKPFGNKIYTLFFTSNVVEMIPQKVPIYQFILRD